MVRLRMKRMGRTHRPFYRICAMDQQQQRDGRVIEELGTYDPMVPETDARVTLVRDRVDYWLSVGAQPSEKVAVLIRKYGTEGSHLEAQQSAVTRLEQHRNRYKLRETVRADMSKRTPNKPNRPEKASSEQPSNAAPVEASAPAESAPAAEASNNS